MKHIVALALAALLLCSAASALAEEYYNIVELRQHTPERLTKSYETKWGQVNIDVPITIPAYDQLPAIAYRNIPYFSIEFPQNATYTDHYGSHCSFDVNIERTFSMIPKGYGASTKPYDGEIAENNSFLPEEATEFADELIRKYTHLVPGIDTEPLVPDATSAYYLYDWNTGEFIEGLGPVDAESLNKGSYEFSVFQCFHGIPLETPPARVTGYTFLSDANVVDQMISWPNINVSIIDKNHYSMSFCISEETNVLAEDLPLAPFDTVWHSVEQYILSGHIRKVDSVRLVAMTGFVPPEGDAAGVSWGVPVWEVECEFWQNPNNGSVNVDTLYLRVDAQTGKIPDLYSKSGTRLRYHELITWDQLP